ncbi:hypothetical protein CgunFtcFv8_015167 [Champsocephalus gunnari]|uniref:Uncharacterized protein n=1 Tax=Champsocephalus gunnari TaxID=52237 RepID=A0AAN8C5S3_CHAGU|nr:hypothetical protein CgunFtcFv8_015167 [Champsocephalus gunnari]
MDPLKQTIHPSPSSSFFSKLPRPLNAPFPLCYWVGSDSRGGRELEERMLQRAGGKDASESWRKGCFRAEERCFRTGERMLQRAGVAPSVVCIDGDPVRPERWTITTDGDGSVSPLP